MIHIIKILFVVFAIPTSLMLAGDGIRQWRKDGKITRYDATWRIVMPLFLTAIGIFYAIGLVYGLA